MATHTIGTGPQEMRAIQGLANGQSSRICPTLLCEELDTPYPAIIADSVQRGPLYLVIRDLVTFWKLRGLALDVISPLKTTRSTDELCLSWKSLIPNAVISIGSAIQAGLVVAAILSFLCLPGIVGLPVLAIAYAIIHIIFLPIQGPETTFSQPLPSPEAQARFASERWIFLNGVAVGGYGLEQNLKQLSQTFGRPVFGVHNCTYGLLGDLVQCILQRSLDYYSQETWAAYRYVEACCKEPGVTKVVLIAHSQGAIMASQVIDRLFLTLVADLVGKVEVYTFGNAALRFNNPIRSQGMLPSQGQMVPTNDGLTVTSDVNSSAHRVIPHIEHYCNMNDMVTRWGVLYSLGNLLSNRFCGRIFISENATGHMLNQHYLKEMFPLHDDHASLGKVSFLDRCVDIDVKTMLKRQETADCHEKTERSSTLISETTSPADTIPKVPVGQVQATSPLNDPILDQAWMRSPLTPAMKSPTMMFGDAEKIQAHNLRDKGIYVVEPSLGHHEDANHLDTAQCRQTVREVSRLWKYIGGGSPEE